MESQQLIEKRQSWEDVEDSEEEELPSSRAVILSGFHNNPTYMQILDSIEVGRVYSIKRITEEEFKIVFVDHRAAEALVANNPLEVEIDDNYVDYVDASFAPDERIEDLDQHVTRIVALTIPGRGKGESTPENYLSILDLDGEHFTASMLIASDICTNEEAQHLAYLEFPELCGVAVSVIRCMTKTENFWLQVEFLSIPDAVRFWNRIEHQRRRPWIETDMAFFTGEGYAGEDDEEEDLEPKTRYGSDEMQELIEFDESDTAQRVAEVDRRGVKEHVEPTPKWKWRNSRTRSRGVGEDTQYSSED